MHSLKPMLWTSVSIFALFYSVTSHGADFTLLECGQNLTLDFRIQKGRPFQGFFSSPTQRQAYTIQGPIDDMSGWNDRSRDDLIIRFSTEATFRQGQSATVSLGTITISPFYNTPSSASVEVQIKDRSGRPIVPTLPCRLINQDKLPQ